jgi:hypothetical protein
MAGARAPLPLVPFSADWMGGDIRGLSALAGSIAQIKAWYRMSARGTPSEAQAELDRLFEEQQQSEDLLLGAMSRETPASAVANGDASFFDGLPDAVSGALKAVPYVGTTVGAGLTIWQDLQADDGPTRALYDADISTGASLWIGGVGGTWHGVADSYDQTRHDLAHDADDLNPLNW